MLKLQISFDIYNSQLPRCFINDLPYSINRVGIYSYTISINMLGICRHPTPFVVVDSWPHFFMSIHRITEFDYFMIDFTIAINIANYPPDTNHFRESCHLYYNQLLIYKETKIPVDYNCFSSN